MRKITHSLLLLFVLIVSISAWAEQSDLQFDRDVSTQLKTQVIEDFAFMQSVQGARESALHQEIFGRLNGVNYINWFDQRVLYFGVDSCGGASAVACVKSKYKKKIFVTNNYIRISHPQIARLMTLYHEARHTEEEHNNWPHSRCPSNFPYRSIWTNRRINGNSACDSTVYGSYASASVLLNNVSKFCENCTDKVKADAKIYSDDQVRRVVNAEAAAIIARDFQF